MGDSQKEVQMKIHDLNFQIIAISMFLAVTGCAVEPARTWNKVGATRQSFEGDKAGCAVHAYRLVPEYRPPAKPITQYRSDCQGSDGRWSCDTRASNGGITTVGAGASEAYEQGQVRDRAEGARNAAFSSCMYDRGWTLQRTN